VSDAGAPRADRRRVDRLAVVVFCALACAFSWPFFWWRDLHPEAWAAWRAPGFVKTASYMWGPGLAAVVCLLVFRRSHVRRVSLFGTSPWRGLAFYLVPLLALAAVGTGGPDGHLMPLVLVPLGFATILGEELGWRGFLQDALAPLSPARRYVLIGVLWELWHFTNRTHGVAPLAAITRVVVMGCVTVALSWIIGEAVERSRSLLVAMTLHGWVDVLFELPGAGTTAVLLAALPFWYVLLRTWGAAPFRPWPLAPVAGTTRPAAPERSAGGEPD
jgi:membrane protease YdiL (CAAX protease family)